MNLSRKILCLVYDIYDRSSYQFRCFILKYIFKCILQEKVDVGNYSYICRNSFLKNVKMGKYCCVGANVAIGVGGEHNYKNFTSFKFFEEPSSPFRNIHSLENNHIECGMRNAECGMRNAECGMRNAECGMRNAECGEMTNIGNDVWIGRDVTIKAGISIGDGSVIGTKSMVTKDVPPYAIVAGNPAKVIKYRFSDDKIKLLQDIEWWNWEPSKIYANLDLLDNFSEDLREI